MSEPSRKRPRITPRNSEADSVIAAAANITPFNDLHQLGKVIHKPNTPQARTPVGPASASKSAPRTAGVRTPNTAGPTPGRTPTGTIRSATRFAIRRGPPTTPHAIRALQQRRNAALTPGRDRRRSGRPQRETPRDDLRKLSRLMAKHSKPIEPSPQGPPSAKRAIRQDLLEEDEENEPPPRLSVPLEDGDEDTGSWHEPPRLSLPLDGEEENWTARSVEKSRRALMRRESYGDPSLADRLAVMDDAVDGEVEHEGVETAPALGDDLLEMEEITGPLSDGDATGELRRAIFGENQGRISGISGEDGSLPPLSDGEPTFQFRYPDRRRSTMLPQPQNVVASQDSIHDDAAPEVDLEEDYETDASDDSQIAMTSTRQIIPPTEPLAPAQAKRSAAKELRVSKHGIEYPSLPTNLVKALAQSFTRQYSGSSKLPKDAVLAIQQASDWFFEQAAEDLAAYAEHAGRKTIDEADAVALMKRQRVLGGNGNQTLFSLAQKFLPRELLQEVKMKPVEKKAKGRKRKLHTIPEEEEDVTLM